MTITAHPRSRGENFRDTLMPALWSGSSPLARGKPGVARGTHEARGLIPARAGKTTRTRGQPCVDWAHPRSRGENSTRGLPIHPNSGSSPLARGKRPRGDRRRRRARLIPARAGKTRQWPQPSASGAAHPRSRGENGTHAHARPKPRGSSPLARGKLELGRGDA